MIRSIRHFLLISLLISITIASSITAIGNYLLDKEVIHNYLDRQLIKISAFIDILSQFSQTRPELRKNIIRYFDQAKLFKQKNFALQVWTQNGRLLLFSPLQPLPLLSDSPPGFSDREIDHRHWRIYTKSNR